VIHKVQKTHLSSEREVFKVLLRA